MMRSFYTRFCGLIALCLVGTAVAQDDTIEVTYQAFLQDVSPVADGAIGDGEYTNSMFLSFVDEENPGNPFPGLNQMCGLVDCNDDEEAEGDADLSATVYWGYTDTDFYIGFDVTDQYIDEGLQGAPHDNDGVEIVIDGDADGEDGRSWSLEGYKLNTDVHGNATSDGNALIWVEEDPVAGEWTHAYDFTDKGYVTEFQVPLGSIDTQSDDPQTTIDFIDEAVAAKTGDTFRMNFAINDIDVEGGNQGTGTHAMWWVYEDDPRSPWQGAEGNWVVGMELAGPSGPDCDFDGDGELGIGDIDMIRDAVLAGNNDLAFDVNGDGTLDSGDVTFFSSDASKMNSWVGDANGDGEFNSGDFVLVFEGGLFETGNAATWSQGDWNADGKFDSGDLVAAFQQGGFELGARATAAVPEPSSMVLLMLGGLALLGRRRR